MTTRTNARVAGAAFLLYIVVGLAPLHGTLYSVVSTLAQAFCALVLGVTLYGITVHQDRELALLGMVSRVAEGVIGCSLLATKLATTATGAPDALIRNAGTWNMSIGGTFFAVGSAIFAWLMLRGRMIPNVLAWIGVIASVLLCITLPLRLGNVISSRVAMMTWIPMALFEIPLAFWLIIKGVDVGSQREPV